APVIGDGIGFVAENHKHLICQFIEFALGQCGGGKVLYFHEEWLYVKEGDALLFVVPAYGDSLTVEFKAVAVEAHLIDFELSECPVALDGAVLDLSGSVVAEERVKIEIADDQQLAEKFVLQELFWILAESRECSDDENECTEKSPFRHQRFRIKEPSAVSNLGDGCNVHQVRSGENKLLAPGYRLKQIQQRKDGTRHSALGYSNTKSKTRRGLHGCYGFRHVPLSDKSGYG